MKQALAGLTLLSILTFCGCVSAPDTELMLTGYKHLVMLPKNFDVSQNYPLIMHLHGRGGAVATMEGFASYGLGDYAKSVDNFPFIVFAPQTPEDWYPPMLRMLLDKILADYPVDPQRIYLTGFSMGGAGVWSMAFAYPDLFAALAPVCGYGNTDAACDIAHLPQWIFHNEDDPVIDSQYSRDMAGALANCGAAHIRTTFYQSASHDAWTATYHTPELYAWFLTHTRQPR